MESQIRSTVSSLKRKEFLTLVKKFTTIKESNNRQRIYNIKAFEHVMSQMNPIYTFITDFFNVYPNLM
jgi:hypothetical protein